MSNIKMPDINNVLIAGKLIDEPVRQDGDQESVKVTFQLTSSRRYRDNSGIWRESVCNVGITVWGELAEKCQAVLHRGDAVIVAGELINRAMKNEDGTTRNVVELRATGIQFLDPQVSQKLEELKATQPEAKELQPQHEAGQTAPAEKERIVEPTEFDFGYQDLKI